MSQALSRGVGAAPSRRGPFAAPGDPAIPALVAASVAFFMIILDTTIVNVARPAIQAALGGGIAALQWVVDGYAVVFASLLLTGGLLSDRFGARRLFALGLLIFSISSLACGAAQSMIALQVARLAQGVGAALTVPAMLALLREAHPDPRRRAKAIAIWAAAGGIAQVVGPIAGGALVTGVGWPAIFLINVPIGFVLVGLAMMRLSRSPAGPARHLDIGGQVLAFLSAVGFASALIEGGRIGFTTSVVLGGLVLSVLAGAAFFGVERRASSPMLPIGFVRQRIVAMSVALGAILNFSYFGQFFVLALFLQEQWRAAPLQAGLAFIPMTAGVVAANLIVGPRVSSASARISLIIGFSLSAVGYLGLCWVDGTTRYAMLALWFGTIGVGGGLIVPAMTVALIGAVQPQMVGLAAGLLNAARQLGGVVGVALFGALIARFGLLSGMRLGLATSVGASVAGAVLAWLLKPRISSA